MKPKITVSSPLSKRQTSKMIYHYRPVNTESNQLLRKQNRYIINYNKICGLEVYPGQIRLVKRNNCVTQNINKIQRHKFRMLTKSVDYRRAAKEGYMTVAEILEEMNNLINRQKKMDVEEEFYNIHNETEKENEKVANKLKEPFPPINIGSLRPYIFDEIFQKKLKK